MRCLVLALLVLPRTLRAEPIDAKEHARALLTAQLAAIRDPAAFLSMLPPDAVLLGNGSFTLAGGPNATSIVAALAPAPVIQTVLTRLNAGASGDAMWLSADAVIVHRSSRCVRCARDRTAVRFVELAIADQETWRVVALSFAATSGVVAPGDALDAARAGPLTRLLAAPSELSAALFDDANTTVVVGAPGHIGDIGIGRDDGRRVLAAWLAHEMKVSGGVEVEAAGWGFVAARVVANDPRAGRDARTAIDVLLIGVRSAKRWSVVAVHALEAAPRRPDRVPVDVPLETRSITP
jgi:hypothetical protein